MNISRQAKRRAARRLGDVVRIEHHSQPDYDWWNYQDTEPAEGYVLDNWSVAVPAYPRAKPVSTRKTPHPSLSRTALRRRLYQRHVPKALWPDLLAKFSGGARNFTLGQPEDRKALKRQYGYGVHKAVMCHVRAPFLIVLDEFGFYAQPMVDMVNESMRLLRKVSSLEATTVVTQSLADFGPQAQPTIARLDSILYASADGGQAAVLFNSAIQHLGRLERRAPVDGAPKLEASIS